MNIKDLENKEIDHKRFGHGKIMAIRENVAIYCFDSGSIELSFPEPFLRSINFKDESIQNFVVSLNNLKKDNLAAYRKLFAIDNSLKIPNVSYYFSPCNTLEWNIFENVSGVGHIESFYSTNSACIGDIYLHYVGVQDKRYNAGCYAIGKVVSRTYVEDKTRVDVEILAIDYENPIITKEEFLTFNKQYRTVCKLNIENPGILNKIWETIYESRRQSTAKDLSLYKNYATIIDSLDKQEIPYRCINQKESQLIVINYDDGPIRFGVASEDGVFVSFSSRCSNFKELEDAINRPAEYYSYIDGEVFTRNDYFLSNSRINNFLEVIDKESISDSNY